MRVVHCVYVAVKPTTVEKARPALVLEDESPDLCRGFHDALKRSPEGFKYTVRLEGFPVVHLQWIPFGQTFGALVFPSLVEDPRQTDPDMVTLLLNGLESTKELVTLAMHFSIQADVWKKVLEAERPVAFNLLYCVGRMREAATITIVNAFANSFFASFGTNEEELLGINEKADRLKKEGGTFFGEYQSAIHDYTGESRTCQRNPGVADKRLISPA